MGPALGRGEAKGIVMAPPTYPPVAVNCASNKFRGLPIYENACQTLRQNQENQFAEFEKKYGDPAHPSRPNGHILLQDSWPLHANGDQTALTYYGFGENTLFLSAEALYRDGNNIGIHELFHIWMRGFVGPEQESKQPAWFSEGLAVYAAGDLERRMTRCRGDRIPVNCVTDVEKTNIPNPWLYYAQFALMIEYLEKNYGEKDAVKTIVQKTRTGIPFHQALEEVARHRQGYLRFYQKASQYALGRLENFEKEDTDYFLKVADRIRPGFSTKIYPQPEQKTYASLREPILNFGRYAHEGTPTEQKLATRKLAAIQANLEQYQGQTFRTIVNLLLGLISIIFDQFDPAVEYFQREMNPETGTLYAAIAYHGYAMALALDNSPGNQAKAIQSWEQVQIFAESGSFRNMTAEQIAKLKSGQPPDRWRF